MRPIEHKFNEDMKNIYFAVKRDIGYTATRFSVSKVRPSGNRNSIITL